KAEVISQYEKGFNLDKIQKRLSINSEQLEKILSLYKDENLDKSRYTEEFKMVVASRHDNGVPQAHIVKEMKINSRTVAKFCDKYGNKDDSEGETESRLYTRIDGEHWREICPSCGSRKNNALNEDSTYCMDCDSEHIYCVEYKTPDDKIFETYQDAYTHLGFEDEDMHSDVVMSQIRSTCFVKKVNFEYMEE
ncbi:MAG: hypothetical protein ACRC4N_16020, partial [Gammaproteobacteria bacterium]